MAELLIQHLSVTFPDTSEAVLDIPALSMRSGERVAVMGPSGSGKTTLVNASPGWITAERAVCSGKSRISGR